MPKIDIKETISTSLASFNATENVVLVPLFIRNEILEDGKPITVRKFTNVNVFRGICKEDNVTKQTVGTLDGIDPSYPMIVEMLRLGLSLIVKFFVHEDFDTMTDMDEAINNLIKAGEFDEFKDKNLYNIKFITSGAHPNLVLVESESSESSEGELVLDGCGPTMTSLAADRGDCVAMVELDDRVDTDPDSEKYIVSLLGKYGEVTNAEYGYAGYPWGFYKSTYTTNKKFKLPACFGYLCAFATSVQSNANWIAAAGVTRGLIPNLYDAADYEKNFSHQVGDALMHILQGDTEEVLKFCVNPIMKVGEYGIRIWGNKTFLKNKSVAEADTYANFMNVRLLLCDIKKQIYTAAMRTTFEPNDDITWISFKMLANTLLDKMQSGRGLSWYSWKRINNAAKATIEAMLTVKPIEAVENFSIEIVLSEEEAEITESQVEI